MVNKTTGLPSWAAPLSWMFLFSAYGLFTAAPMQKRVPDPVAGTRMAVAAIEV